MSKKYYSDSGNGGGDTGGRLLLTGVVLGIVPLIMTVYWAFLHWLAPGTKYPYTFDRWEMAHWFTEGWNFFGGTPLLWIFFALLAVAVGFVWGVEASDGKFAAGLTIGIVGFLVCIGFAVPGLVSRDKVPAQFYQRGTTFYVADPNEPPAALHRLVQGGRKGYKGCAIKPVHDVPSCVQKGVLPDTPGLWQGRSSSYDGAKTMLSSSTATQQGADLMEASLTYLGGDKPETERWTGIIDGSGAYNPAQGVVEWYGQTGTVKKCLFNDQRTGTTGYKFKRAFGGAKMNSLSHKILSTYTGYMYDDQDVWGYCNGNKPVFVVPMTKYVPFHHQVFRVPAGVLIIRGSDNGDPIFDFRKDVKPGELDGPVVPTTLVAKQRETLDWAAGRKYRKSSGGNNGGFGFDVASAETQEGNDSEYRLYNTQDRRWYYVSTLVPNNAKSQTYTALALTPTDELHAGELPKLNVYVLDDDPAKQANADRLHSEALNFIGNNYPGFRTNGGDLHEIVPLGGDMWRVFGEVKGYTALYIDMSANNRVTPKVTDVTDKAAAVGGAGASLGGTGLPGATPTGPAPSGTPSDKVCGKQPKDMSTAEKTACVKALVDSLASGQRK